MTTKTIIGVLKKLHQALVEQANKAHAEKQQEMLANAIASTSKN